MLEHLALLGLVLLLPTENKNNTRHSNYSYKPVYPEVNAKNYGSVDIKPYRFSMFEKKYGAHPLYPVLVLQEPENKETTDIHLIKFGSIGSALVLLEMEKYLLEQEIRIYSQLGKSTSKKKESLEKKNTKIEQILTFLETYQHFTYIPDAKAFKEENTQALGRPNISICCPVCREETSSEFLRCHRCGYKLFFDYMEE